ncbi:MAG TPA: hypothetical protein VF530_01245 [Planctomycetota bacterium]
MRPLVLAGALLVSLAPACASTELEWERIEDPHFLAADGSYTLELPLGWARTEQALTHDGWEHQTITFNAGAVLAPAEGQAIDAASPELLAAMQDELSAQPGIELVEVRPARLDGLSGFRMHFRRLPLEEGGEAPPQQAVLYAAIDGVTLYAFSLECSDPATFGRDLQAFELMVASFRRLVD